MKESKQKDALEELDRGRVKMETIYKNEYFVDNCLSIAPYELFRNSVCLINETKDEGVKQHLINELCMFTGMIDFQPLLEECERELKKRKFISEDTKIDSSIEEDDVEEDDEDMECDECTLY